MDSERNRIDPGGRYPASGLTSVERCALAVRALLPNAQMERTRDVFQFDDGGQAGIVVVVTPEAVELRLPTIEWTKGAYGPAPTSVLWRRLDGGAADPGALQKSIAAARRARKRQFATCRFCGESFPPEYGFERDVCQGCALNHLGVVF